MVGWVVLQREDGRILLARRAGVSYGAGQWGLPGGHAEPTESWRVAAARELREEVGVEVAPADLEPVGIQRYLDGDHYGIDLFLRARRWQGEPRPVSECSEVGWFAPDQLPADALGWLGPVLALHLRQGVWFGESGFDQDESGASGTGDHETGEIAFDEGSGSGGAGTSGLEHGVRQATVADAGVVAELLDAFNREFGTPTPGPAVLEGRLRALLPGNDLLALLAVPSGQAEEPALGLALLSFRPSVWYEGPVATLDELYVRPDHRGRRIGHALLETACRLAVQRGAGTMEINVDGEDIDARRFYRAHGFTDTEPGATEPMYLYYRDLS